MDSTNPHTAPGNPGANSHGTFTFVHALLLAGSSFIVIALVVMIVSSWDSFSPASRMLMALIPPVVLYSLGLSTRNKPEQKALSDYTILTASITVPFVLGVILYQSGIRTVLDNTFYFAVLAPTTLLYCLIEFGLRRYDHAVLTIIASLGTALYFGRVIDASFATGCYIALILAAFYLVAAWNARSHYVAGNAYALAGGGTGLVASLIVPFAHFHTVGWETTLTYVAISVVYFYAAAVYSRLWQRDGHIQALQLRQICEHVAALTLTVPVLMQVLDRPDDTASCLMALVLGTLALLLSMKVRVQTFRWGGAVDVIVGVLLLLSFAFTHLAAVWPVLLLIIGFLFIGAAYYLVTHNVSAVLARLNYVPEESLFGLGINPEPKPAHYRQASLTAKPGEPAIPSRDYSSNGSVFLVIVVVFLILLVLSQVGRVHY